MDAGEEREVRDDLVRDAEAGQHLGLLRQLEEPGEAIEVLAPDRLEANARRDGEAVEPELPRRVGRERERLSAVVREQPIAEAVGDERRHVDEEPLAGVVAL